MPSEKKKLLILSILEILRTSSDAKHGIRQLGLIDLLQTRYGLSATRKSVRQNLSDLENAGYPVAFNHGWYYQHPFSSDELDYLISCTAGSSLTADQRISLISRIAELGGEYYQPDAQKGRIQAVRPDYAEMVALLRSAIAEDRMVRFHYIPLESAHGLKDQADDAVVRQSPATLHVLPKSLTLQDGDYLMTGCMEKSLEACVFSLRRMTDLSVLKKSGQSRSR